MQFCINIPCFHGISSQQFVVYLVCIHLGKDQRVVHSFWSVEVNGAEVKDVQVAVT